jgi:hypothetical protein
MDDNLKATINNSIEIYYKKNYEWYTKIFNDENIIITTKNINNYNKKYYDTNKNNTELLGVYNINTSIFSWAYILPKKFNNNNTIIKELFDWAYKKNTNSNSDIFFRKIFLNSNINIKTKEQLNIIVCISYYILQNASDTIISIENNNIIKYYIVKK